MKVENTLTVKAGNAEMVMYGGRFWGNVVRLVVLDRGTLNRNENTYSIPEFLAALDITKEQVMKAYEEK